MIIQNQDVTTEKVQAPQSAIVNYVMYSNRHNEDNQ